MLGWNVASSVCIVTKYPSISAILVALPPQKKNVADLDHSALSTGSSCLSHKAQWNLNSNFVIQGHRSSNGCVQPGNAQRKGIPILQLKMSVFIYKFLTVTTILLTAAADRSSPLGWSTSVMPRWRRLKVMPSKMVSRVSVQFSGSSEDKRSWLHVEEGKKCQCASIYSKWNCWMEAILFLVCSCTLSRSEVLPLQSKQFS